MSRIARITFVDDDDGADGLNEYERERVMNIKRNRAMLAELAIPAAVRGLALAQAATAAPAARSKKRGRVGIELPRRRSPRFHPLEAEPADSPSPCSSASNSDAFAFESEEEEAAKRARRRTVSCAASAAAAAAAPAPPDASALPYSDEEYAVWVGLMVKRMLATAQDAFRGERWAFLPTEWDYSLCSRAGFIRPPADVPAVCRVVADKLRNELLKRGYARLVPAYEVSDLAKEHLYRWNIDSKARRTSPMKSNAFYVFDTAINIYSRRQE